MPRLSLDAELDRLLAECDDENRYTEISIVLRRLSISPQLTPGARLTDDQGGEWIVGEVRNGVQPVASTVPGASRSAKPGLKLRSSSGAETLLIADEVLRAGGVWDNVENCWRRQEDGARQLALNPVIVDLQESQLDAAVWFAGRLKAFRERQKHEHCVGLLLDDRRGGKSFICTLFVLCAAVDCPQVNNSPSELWIVTQSHPARDELDEIIRSILPSGWAKYRELPKRIWIFRHGAKVHMKTTDDPESLRVGRVDWAFGNEAALLPEAAYEIMLRGTQDRAGCMLLASNRPKRTKGRWVIRLWEGAEKDEREGKQASVKLLRVPPALNTAIDHGAKAGIARAIMYAKDLDDESQLDEGLILEAGQKLLAPPWDDNLHITLVPEVGMVDVTRELTRRHYGREFELLGGADFQSQCAAAWFKLIAPAGRINEVRMYCVGAVFLTDKDNGDEDDLCQALNDFGVTPSRILIIGDSSGRWQNGRHELGLESFNRIKRHHFEITGPTTKKTEKSTHPANPRVDASLMRFRKWIKDGRFYVSMNSEAQIMALACKRCDAYVDRYQNLRPKGKWAHLVDCARYPQWWLTEKLAIGGSEVPNYVRNSGRR